MIAKIVNFFEMDGAGWSEIWYIRDAADVKDAKTRALTVAGFRSKLQASTCVMVGLRASNVEIPGAAALDKTTAANDTGAAGALQHDVWTTAARVHMVAASGYNNRQAWIRGLPDQYLAFRDTTDRELWLTALLDPIQAWFDSMKANGYAIRAKVKDNPPGTNPQRIITSLSPETATGGTRVTATGITVNHGVDSVRITGCKFYSNQKYNINKTWKTVAPPGNVVLGPNDFLIPMAGPPTNDPEDAFKFIMGSGRAQLVKVDYLFIEEYYLDFFTSRKTGNPFFKRAGRLSKAKSR